MASVAHSLLPSHSRLSQKGSLVPLSFPFVRPRALRGPDFVCERVFGLRSQIFTHSPSSE